MQRFHHSIAGLHGLAVDVFDMQFLLPSYSGRLSENVRFEEAVVVGAWPPEVVVESITTVLSARARLGGTVPAAARASNNHSSALRLLWC